MAVEQRHLTLEEFLKLPEEAPALEYTDEGVVQKVSPKSRHSKLQFALAKRIDAAVDPRKLAAVFPELRTTFAGRSLVPDLAVYRWERIPRTPGGELADDVFDPPDVAVEIASPDQHAAALVRRCLWYVDHGVQVALLVDPDDCSVIAFRPASQPRARCDADPIELPELAPDVALTVADLFAALDVR